MQIREMEDVIRQSQAYSTTLQTYNTTLQNDLKEEKSKRDEAARERDLLQGKVAELGGQAKSLEQQLSYERVGCFPATPVHNIEYTRNLHGVSLVLTASQTCI